MQVLKKISLMTLFLVLTACHQILPSATPYMPSQSRTYSNAIYYGVDDIDDNEQFDSNAFEVAMLLPLSGKSSAYGQGMQNAAMMALEDTKNKKLSVHFYDTKSSPEGAMNALADALKNKAKLVLGPLTSDEVTAISSQAKSKRVPVISFSTSPQVLGNGVYSIGLLSDEQVRRIVSFAASKGRSKLAVVVPDTSAGLNIAKAATQAAAQNNMKLTKIGFYEPSTLEFSDLVQNMIKNPDFDTILIAETGSRLKAIASTFGYFDVAYPDVLFVGTSVWENTNLSKETTLYNAVYPVMSRVHNDYFNKKYTDLFGDHPNNLYSFAYDSIALASALSRMPEARLNDQITHADGYVGINGSFRFFEDGTNEHNLDVIEIQAKGNKTVSNAPKKFGAKPYHGVYESAERPEVYGKDSFSVYQKIYPVKEPSYFDRPSYFNMW